MMKPLLIVVLAVLTIPLVSCGTVDRSKSKAFRNDIGKRAILTRDANIVRARRGDLGGRSHVRELAMREPAPPMVVHGEILRFWTQPSDCGVVHRLKKGDVIRLTRVVEHYGIECDYAMLYFCELEDPPLKFEYRLISGYRNPPYRPWRILPD